MGVDCRVKGKGVNKAISTSKTRKITANRKNRREKGIRAVESGSNPHSKGVTNSCLSWGYDARTKAKINSAIGTIREKKIAKEVVSIFLGHVAFIKLKV